MNGLLTERLHLRRWEDHDRPVFHRLQNDTAVMRFFPRRLDRAEADQAMDEWNAAFDRHGMEFLAAERRGDGEVIGMIGLAPVEDDRYPFARGTVQIGWRLLPEASGQGYATEGAAACVRHGFEILGLDRIVSYCCVDNHASEAVMQRLGFAPAGEFDHPKIDPRTHSHLVRHKLYQLQRNGRKPQN